MSGEIAAMQSQAEAGQPIVPPVQGGNEPLGILLQRLVEYAYAELQSLLETAPGMDEERRKYALVKHVLDMRGHFLRMLVLIRWALENGDRLQTLRSLYAFLGAQNGVYEACANTLLSVQRTMHQNMRGAFDVPTAVDVLSSGTYSRLPAVLDDMLLPPAPLPAAAEVCALERASQQIRFRLATYDVIPSAMRRSGALSVRSGCAIVDIPYVYRAVLTLSGLQKSAHWRLLHVELLAGHPGVRQGGSGSLLPHQGTAIAEMAASELEAASAATLEAAPALRTPDRALLRTHRRLWALGQELLLESLFSAVPAATGPWWVDANVRDAFLVPCWAPGVAAVAQAQLAASQSDLWKEERISGASAGLHVRFSLVNDLKSERDDLAVLSAPDDARPLQRIKLEHALLVRAASRKSRGPDPPDVLVCVDAVFVSPSGQILSGPREFLCVSSGPESLSPKYWTRRVQRVCALAAVDRLYAVCASLLPKGASVEEAEIAVQLIKGDKEARVRVAVDANRSFDMEVDAQTGRILVTAGHAAPQQLQEAARLERVANADVALGVRALRDLRVDATAGRQRAIAAAVGLERLSHVLLRASGAARLAAALPDNAVQPPMDRVDFYSLDDKGSAALAVLVAGAAENDEQTPQTWLWLVFFDRTDPAAPPHVSKAHALPPRAFGDSQLLSWPAPVALAPLARISRVARRAAAWSPWLAAWKNQPTAWVLPNARSLDMLAALGNGASGPLAALWPAGTRAVDSAFLTLLDTFPLAMLCVRPPFLTGGLVSAASTFLCVRVEENQYVAAAPASVAGEHWRSSGACDADAPQRLLQAWIHALHMQAAALAVDDHLAVLQSVVPGVRVACDFATAPPAIVISAADAWQIRVTVRVPFTLPSATKDERVHVAATLSLPDDSVAMVGLYSAMLTALIDEQVGPTLGTDGPLSWCEQWSLHLVRVLAAWSTYWPLHKQVHAIVAKRARDAVQGVVPMAIPQSLCEIQLVYHPASCGFAVGFYADASQTLVRRVSSIGCSDIVENPAHRLKSQRPADVGGWRSVRMDPLPPSFADMWGDIDRAATAAGIETRALASGRVVEAAALNDTLSRLDDALYQQASALVVATAVTSAGLLRNPSPSTRSPAF